MVRWLVTCATEAGELVFPTQRNGLLHDTHAAYNANSGRFTTLVLGFTQNRTVLLSEMLTVTSRFYQL